MQHGNQFEEFSFSGHQIRLKDLKAGIIEMKKLTATQSRNSEVDLKIFDADEKTKGCEFIFINVITFNM